MTGSDPLFERAEGRATAEPTGHATGRAQAGSPSSLVVASASTSAADPTAPSVARILGVDPGSMHLGWGVLDSAGSRTQHIASGTLHAPAQAPLVERLVWLAAGLEEVLLRWRPQVAAVESVFYGSNVKSALVLGHARGAVLVTIGRSGLALAEYAPTRIKQAATGTGGADKAQVAAMMAMLLGLTAPLEVDTTDALAAAWCHAQAAGSSFAPAGDAGAPKPGRRGTARRARQSTPDVSAPGRP